jgi:hypothetical protein
VPAHQRLRPYNLQSVQHPGSQAVEPNQQQPVDAPEGHSLRGFASQNVQLMPKYKDFGFQRSPRPEQPDQPAPDQSAKIAHRRTIDRFADVSQLFWVCGGDSGVKSANIESLDERTPRSVLILDLARECIETGSVRNNGLRLQKFADLRRTHRLV